MSLSRYEFEVLRCLERRGDGRIPVRAFCEELCISGRTVENCLDALAGRGLLSRAGEELRLTPEGREALEPYRVRKAIILAAGFGSRMMPATEDRPKPMVRVRGKRIIDTLLDALAAAEIRDVTVVGGYRWEKLEELRKDYSFLRLLRNEEYAETNNISSAVRALEQLSGGCYLCEADLFLSNPDIITKYQYASNILGSYSLETDDWCYSMEDGCLADYRKGGVCCYNYYGISYWTAGDCEKLKRDFSQVYREPEGKQYFWEFVPFVLKKENYRVEIRPCSRRDIVEIDSFEELAQLDPSYGDRKGEA